MAVDFSALPKAAILTARAGSYELYGRPWLVPLLVIALGNARRAALPRAVGILTMGATLFFYIHFPDPTWWIAASARRVLLTPLAALLIAAVAAYRQPV